MEGGGGAYPGFEWRKVSDCIATTPGQNAASPSQSLPPAVCSPYSSIHLRGERESVCVWRNVS